MKRKNRPTWRLQRASWDSPSSYPPANGDHVLKHGKVELDSDGLVHVGKKYLP